MSLIESESLVDFNEIFYFSLKTSVFSFQKLVEDEFRKREEVRKVVIFILHL